MDKEQALQVFVNLFPASGLVDYESVENALRNTPEGRKALRYLHTLRRSGAISATIENGRLMVGRAQAAPAGGIVG